MTPKLTDLVRRLRDARTPLGDEAADAIEALAAAQEWQSDDAIAAIEAGNRRWRGITEQCARWEPYKLDGQRQMKAKGRWQVQEWNGDFFKWSNLPRRPDGVRPAPPVTP